MLPIKELNCVNASKNNRRYDNVLESCTKI
uniref:Uncharacterized protein n=1 Tax=Arundo donax TaxID=35708 RepID=A0A0A9E2F9_ARUDO